MQTRPQLVSRDPEWDAYVKMITPKVEAYVSLTTQVLHASTGLTDAVQLQVLKDQAAALSLEIRDLSRVEDPRFQALVLELQRKGNPAAYREYSAHMAGIAERGFSIHYSAWPADPNLQLSFTIGLTAVGQAESVIVAEHSMVEADAYHSARARSYLQFTPTHNTIRQVDYRAVDPAGLFAVLSTLKGFYEDSEISLVQIMLPDDACGLPHTPSYAGHRRPQRQCR